MSAMEILQQDRRSESHPMRVSLSDRRKWKAANGKRFLLFIGNRFVRNLVSITAPHEMQHCYRAFRWELLLRSRRWSRQLAQRF